MMKNVLLILSSVVILCLAVACTDEAQHDEHLHDHDHGDNHGHVHHAAHGGTLLEVGAHQANLEVVCDREAGTVHIYVFGPHAERPVRLAIEELAINCTINEQEFPVMLKAQANALSEEEVGDTATFMLADERFKTTAPLHVQVPSVSIFGQSFENITGTIK